MRQDLIKIGQITSPHGVHGQVRLFPLTDFPERFHTLRTALLGPDARPVRVTFCGTVKNMVIIEIEGVTDRNQADLLRQQYLQVPPSEAFPLPEGHYYLFDLIGLDVLDPDGNRLGRLVHVDQSSLAHDLYVVETDSKRRYMVPAVQQFIQKIDLPAGHLVIVPIPGLLED